MFDLRSLLTRRASPPATSMFLQSGSQTRDLVVECEAIVWTHLAHARIPSSGLKVQAVADERRKPPVVTAKLYVSAWHDGTILRLMIGLPLLERKVRSAFEASWLKDVCTFGGIWLRGFGELQSQEAAHRLRQAIARIESQQPRPDDSPDELWSIPTGIRKSTAPAGS